MDVVNMSVGFGFFAGDCDLAGDANVDLLRGAIDTLYAAGVVTVAGTGNSRLGTGMIAPACLANVVSAGAVWDADLGPQNPLQACLEPETFPDLVACFSNSGPTTDVFAPGAHMTTTGIDGLVANAAVGTSFSTPVVSACAAALRQASSGASADEIAAALRTSATGVVDETNGIEFPRLDCRAALRVLIPDVPTLPAGAPLRLGVAALLTLLGAGALASRGRRRGPVRRSG